MVESWRRQQQRMSQRYPMPLTEPYVDAMENIARVQTSELDASAGSDPARRPKVRSSKTEIHPKIGAIFTIPREAVVMPRVPAVPTAIMWTALRTNYDVNDEPQLKYLPYFGDDDEEDVISEFYEIKKKEGSSVCEVDFLKETCEHVLRRLKETWELNTRDLELIAKTLQVEVNVVKEVRKKMEATRAAKRAKKRSLAATSAPAPETHDDMILPADFNGQSSLDHYSKVYEKEIDSYRSLFCRRCFAYDCDYHGVRTVPTLVIGEQNAVYTQLKTRDSELMIGRNCQNQCYLGRTQSSQPFSKKQAVVTAFGWDKLTQVECARAYLLCSGNYCKMAKLLHDKTCLEVAEYCEFYDINDRSITKLRSPRINKRPSKKKKRKKTPSIAHLQYTTPGPMDVIPTAITPCAHAGSCENASCVCYEEGHLCSKLCHCIHDECNIFFRGCSCVKGRCRTKACPCFAAGHECDLDLCTVCCADEAAFMGSSRDKALTTPSSEDVKSMVKSQHLTCQNRNMSRQKRKRVHVGRSILVNAGWGLFVDEFVAKDEFVIEYLGEMVSQEEAERRGAVYDKLNSSYLFNLNSATVVDATRKGNKTRFINHSTKPNCYCKILNVNSDHRIAIFAMHNIPPHTELFFDYGYDRDLQHESLHKTPTITEWMKHRPVKRPPPEH